MASPAEIARAFIDAMNAYDADALVELLAHDVVLDGYKGTYVGHDEARRWLGTPGPNLRSRIDVHQIREDGHRALAATERTWIWVDGDEEAETENWNAVWWTRDGKVVRWKPFQHVPEAVEAFESGESG